MIVRPWREVLQKLEIPIDIITFGFVVWNFSVVGVLVTFFWPAPLIMKQGYLIFIGKEEEGLGGTGS